MSFKALCQNFVHIITIFDITREVKKKIHFEPIKFTSLSPREQVHHQGGVCDAPWAQGMGEK
jgi:hypothetical protein